MCFSSFSRAQIVALTGSFLHSMAIPFILGFPSVMNPALLLKNSTDITATADQTSWLAASCSISSIAGYFFYPFIMQSFGRKMALHLLNITIIIGWIIVIFSRSITVLFIGRVIQGLGCAGLYINAIILAEYSHPTRRGYLCSIKKAFGYLGLVLCHGLSSVLGWRAIALVALLPAVGSVIATFYWVESPVHLAVKGKYEECEESFFQLFGTSKDSRKELKELVETQKEIRDRHRKKKTKFLKKMCDKGFLKSLFIISVITILVESSGKLYFMAYVIEFMRAITKDNSVAIACSVASETLSMLAIALSCITVKIFGRRTLIVTCSYVAVVLMLSVGFIDYFVSDKIISSWMIVFVLLFHNFFVCISSIPVSFILYGELFPFEYRGIGSCLSGVISSTASSITLKLTPAMVAKTGIGGVYVTYGLCMLVSVGILHLILPETKDKTLQQVENDIKGVKYNEVELEKIIPRNETNLMLND